MTKRLSDELTEKVLARFPLPIADAVSALDAAESLYERRDRVVEVFRSWLRTVAATALAVRLQFGPGPGGESDVVPRLLSSLRRRGLTDGQWLSLCRELLRAYSDNEVRYPVPALVRLFFVGKRSPVGKDTDGLLDMRKSETVAHGATGDAGDLEDVLSRRLPQLERLLDASTSLFEQTRLVVPLAPNEDGQRAWNLSGYTPARGKWRRITLASGDALAAGEPILVDGDGKPLVALHPIAMVRRPTPEAVEECFFLDGSSKRGAVYVAFPSMSEYRDRDAWEEIDVKLGGKHSGPQEVVAGLERPYRGLSAFDTEHAQVFFGRAQLADEVANRIRRHAMVTVTGPSGSGKSSLINAGVLPKLTDYQILRLRPGSHPVSTLARRLDAVVGQPWLAARARAGFAESLEVAPGSVGALVDEWAHETGVSIVVVVDQAEELFTLCKSDEERETFADAVASIGCDPDGPLRVVLSLREDFFARLATLEPLRGVYTRQVEVVTTPDRAALVETLVNPASMFGFQFEDEELVDAIVEPMVGKPAALPLLQFCADQLWDRRDRSWQKMTWEALRELGGVEGALAAHAEATLEDLTAAQQEAAKLLLLHLITEDRTRAVVDREELLETSGGRRDAEVVLDRLIEARLIGVREGEEDGSASIEIVHEALIGRWERLRQWLDEDREYHVVRQRVLSAEGRWRREGKVGDLLLGVGKPLSEAEELLAAHPELLRAQEIEFIEASRRRAAGRRRLRMFAVIGLALLAAAATLFGLFALKQQREARESLRLADERKEQVERAAEDIILLQASSAMEHDPTEAVAWLKKLDVTDDNAVRVRAIAEEAHHLGVAKTVYETGVQYPSWLVLGPRERSLFVVTNRGTVLELDLASGDRKILHEGATTSSAVVSSSSRYVLSYSYMKMHDGDTDYLIDLHTGEKKKVEAGQALSGRPVLAPDGTWVLTVGVAGGSVRDLRTGEDRRLGSAGVKYTRMMYDVTENLFVAFHDEGIDTIDPDTGEATLVTRTEVAGVLDGGGIPGDRLFVFGTRSGGVTWLDYDTGKVTAPDATGAARYATPIELLPSDNGKDVFVIFSDGRVGRWGVEKRANMGYLPVRDNKIRGLVVSESGDMVVGAAQDGELHVVDIESGTGPTLIGGANYPSVMALSKDGTLYSATSNGYVRVWSKPTLTTASLEDGRGVDLAFNAAGELVATGGRFVSTFDASGGLISKVDLERRDDEQTKLSKDGEKVLLWGKQGVRLWTRAGGQVRQISSKPVRRVRFSSDSDEILFATSAEGVFRVDLAGMELARFDLADYEELVLGARGDVLVVGEGGEPLRGGGEKGLLFYKAGADKPVRLGALSFDSGALSDDGKYAVGGGPEGEVVVIEIATGKSTTAKVHNGKVMQLYVTPDSTQVLSMSSDREIHATVLSSGESRLVGTLFKEGAVGAFSAGGERFITVGFMSGDVQVWNLAAGTSTRLSGARTMSLAVAISPDLSRVVALSGAGSLRRWRLDAPTEPAALQSWLRSLTSLRYDPKLRRLTEGSAAERASSGR